jgi:cytochrome oxidase Cu insertion factor (SCO1/SenC/PrrC family)
MRNIPGGLAALGALLLALAAGAADKAPEENTGIKTGTKAPTFTLKDQDGKERSLSDLLKKGKVALVFYRSANW